ncbi:TPA: hypothetical protein ACGOYB_001333 [Streptococcus suis]
MQEWLAKFFKKEKPINYRPLYSLEQDNVILREMNFQLREKCEQYRMENQKLSDKNALLERRLVGSKYEQI